MTAKTIAGVVVLLVIGKPALAGAVMQTFIAVKDAKMRSDDGGQCANAMGSVVPLLVGVNCAKLPCFTGRTLLHFDLSAIPHGSTVSGATLQLWVSGMINSGTAAHISVMRSRQPLWDEGALIWETYDCPENSWCNVGGDFDDQANVVPWSLSTTGIKTINHANLAALVNDAVQRRGGQLPLFFKQTVESTDPWVMVQFSSREDTDPDFRPQLTLTWTAPAPTPGPTPAWVTFRDETATRLTLTTVPANDPEEKDIAVADFDDDGDEDLVITRKRPFDAYGPRAPVLLRNDDGVLVNVSGTLLGDLFGPAISANGRDIGAFDLNGDDREDLVIANTCDEDPTFYRNKGGRCESWFGFRRQDAWTPSIPSNQAARFCAVAAGDIDKDGPNSTDRDLFFAAYVQSCAPGDGGQGDPNPLLPSDKDLLAINNLVVGTGAPFEDQSTARLGANATNEFGTAAEMHDVDGDSDLEIIKTCTRGCPLFAGNDVYILKNDGTGKFTSPMAALGMPAPYMFFGDNLGGDSKVDFYVVDDDEDVVHINQGGFTFTQSPVSSTRTAKFGGNVKGADLDGDGYVDMGVGDVDVEIPSSCDLNPSAPRRFALLRNQGGSYDDPFTTEQNFQMLSRVHDFAFIDINRDGCPDLFQGLCDGYRVFINTTPGCADGVEG